MGFRNGSQICLGNGNCIRSNRIWVSVCIGFCHMMPFCDDLWSNPRSRFPSSEKSEPCDGYLLLALSIRRSSPHHDNELKQATSSHHRGVEKSL